MSCCNLQVVVDVGVDRSLIIRLFLCVGQHTAAQQKMNLKLFTIVFHCKVYFKNIILCVYFVTDLKVNV